MGFRYGLGWLVSLFLEMNEDFQLGALNSRPELDNTTFLNQFIIDEENDFNIFNDTQINSLYFNIETFSTKCRSENKPVVISLNIQSLQSKLNELVTLLTSLSSKNIFITEVEVLVFICGIILNSKNYKICPPSEKNYLNLYQ